MWQECGRLRHETGNRPSIDQPNDLSRAPMPRLEIRPSGRTPGVFFICRNTRGCGAGPEVRTHHSQILDPHTHGPGNFLVGTPIQFPNFLGNKNRVVGTATGNPIAA
jgi:hypothetical protein